MTLDNMTLGYLTIGVIVAYLLIRATISMGHRRSTHTRIIRESRGAQRRMDHFDVNLTRAQEMKRKSDVRRVG